MRPEQHGKHVSAETLREELRHVYWIGGGSAAGKSTTARRIAAQHRLNLYTTDDVMSHHASRGVSEDSPLLSKFMAMDMDERWIQRSPKIMLETFPWFQGECFDLIVEDLLRLPRRPGLIVEGLRLLPHLVKPLLAMPRRAIWLLPTPDFRKAVFERRGPAWGFFLKTSDPERALLNLLERDQMFTDRLRRETKHLELPAIDVDTRMTEDDLVERTNELFGL